MNHLQHGWFDTQRIACRGTEFKMMGKTPDQRRTGKRWRRQVVEFGEKPAFLLVAARREGRVAGDAERMMVEFLLVITSAPAHRCVQRKIADQQWTMNSSESVEEFRGSSSEKSLR